MVEEEPKQPMKSINFKFVELKSKKYLLLVDHYSQFCWLHQFRKTPDTDDVIEAFKLKFNDEV